MFTYKWEYFLVKGTKFKENSSHYNCLHRYINFTMEDTMIFTIIDTKLMNNTDSSDHCITRGQEIRRNCFAESTPPQKLAIFVGERYPRERQGNIGHRRPSRFDDLFNSINLGYRVIVRALRIRIIDRGERTCGRLQSWHDCVYEKSNESTKNKFLMFQWMKKESRWTFLWQTTCDKVREVC